MLGRRALQLSPTADDSLLMMIVLDKFCTQGGSTAARKGDTAHLVGTELLDAHYPWDVANDIGDIEQCHSSQMSQKPG